MSKNDALCHSLAMATNGQRLGVLANSEGVAEHVQFLSEVSDEQLVRYRSSAICSCSPMVPLAP